MGHLFILTSPASAAACDRPRAAASTGLGRPWAGVMW